MTVQKLLDIISQGEGVTVEFKECKNEVSSDAYPTVCSFSNRYGGHLFMGIDDNGNIKGVNPKCIKDMRKNFSSMLNNPQKFSPTLFLSVEEYVIDGKTILYVYIPKSSQVISCNKLVYDRVEDEDVDITRSSSQMEALYLRKQSDFTEKKLFPYVKTDDLRFDLLPRIRTLAKSENREHPWVSMDDMELFRSAGLYEQDYVTGQLGFNLAAVLLLGKDETIKSCLPAYRTDAIYREKNIDRYDDRDDVRTNLIEAYDRLIAFINKHTNDEFFLEGVQRISVRSIIAREIVSNILMHREYANPFPAKLIIQDGKIHSENANKVYRYGQIKLDDFTPFPKNPIIANFFSHIGRADELGSGVRNLYKYTKLYYNTEPELFEDDVFRVDVDLGNIGANNSEKPIKTDKEPIKADKLSKNEKKILDYISKNGEITNSDARDLLGLADSTTKRLLGSMVKKDLLSPVGERKSREYLLKQ